MNRLRVSVVGLITGLAFSNMLFAQDDWDAVEISAQPVADGIFMLSGRGGNLGLAVGDDATFLIDDQFAPLTDKIVAAIAEVTDRPVDYVLNTHWHFDHSGGNENLGKQGALILAHDNVRQRMSTGQRLEAFNMDIPPSPKVALPVITFDSRLSLHVNGMTILGKHVPHAHTDGDTMVWFESVNVLHMGDIFFNGLYPFIDLESGGSVSGMIAAVEVALDMIDVETKIVPGHGPLATRVDLEAYHAMLVGIRNNVAEALAAGESIEAIVAAKPSAEFDEVANRFGFLTPDQFVTTVATSLSQDGS